MLRGFRYNDFPSCSEKARAVRAIIKMKWHACVSLSPLLAYASLGRRGDKLTGILKAFFIINEVIESKDFSDLISDLTTFTGSDKRIFVVDKNESW